MKLGGNASRRMTRVDVFPSAPKCKCTLPKKIKSKHLSGRGNVGFFKILKSLSRWTWGWCRNTLTGLGGLMDRRHCNDRASLWGARKGKKEREGCVLGGANSTVFPSSPEWLLVPCRSLYIQRLLGGPCLEVASWRVTVTIRTGCSRGAWYSRLSRKTRRSSLSVPAVLTVAGSSWLTCGHKLILGHYIHQSIHLSFF